MTTPEQLKILQHTLGDHTNYRNHFCGGPGHHDHEICLELVSLGLMTKGEKFEQIVFWATDEGKKEAWKHVCLKCKSFEKIVETLQNFAEYSGCFNVENCAHGDTDDNGCNRCAINWAINTAKELTK